GPPGGAAGRLPSGPVDGAGSSPAVVPGAVHGMLIGPPAGRLRAAVASDGRGGGGAPGTTLRSGEPRADPTNVEDPASSGHPSASRLPGICPVRWHNEPHDDAFTDTRGR